MVAAVLKSSIMKIDQNIDVFSDVDLKNKVQKFKKNAPASLREILRRENAN